MKCPKCQSENKVKNGIIKQAQRYKCKDCGCNYTIDYQRQEEKEKKRRFALSMYLEGLGFHSIGRLLGVSHVSIINWVRKYGKELSSIRNPCPVKVMELDETHSFCGHKKTIVGHGLVLTGKNDSTMIFKWETEAHKQG